MMMLVLLGTFCSSVLALYFSYKKKLVAIIGAFLYTFMPYRVYVCFDKKDMNQALFWMVVPLILVCLVRIYSEKNKKRSLLWMIPASIIVALLSLTDATLVVILACVIALAGLLLKRWLYIPIGIAGLAGGFFVNIDFWKFLILGHDNAYAVESISIAGRGYYFADYFMNWMYYEEKPGIGFGLLFSLGLILWIYLINLIPEKEKYNPECMNNKEMIMTVILSLAVGIMAFHWGIWDLAERVHPIVLRFISTMKSPGLLMGFACGILCIPASDAIAILWKKEKVFVGKVIPIFVLTMNAVAAAYQIIGLI